MGGLSWWHWLLIVLAFVVLFGAKRLPDAARGLGRSMRILKTEVSEMHKDGEDQPRPEPVVAAVPVAPVPVAPVPVAGVPVAPVPVVAAVPGVAPAPQPVIAAPAPVAAPIPVAPTGSAPAHHTAGS